MIARPTIPVEVLSNGTPQSRPIDVTMVGSSGGGGGSIDGYVLRLLGWLLGFRLLRSGVRI